MGETTVAVAKEAPTPEQLKANRVEQKNPDRTTDQISDITPIALYTEVEGHPYSAEFFDVMDIYKDEMLNLEDDLNDIDKVYKQQVQLGIIEDGKESFSNLIKQAEKVTNSKNMSKGIKIAKIAEWFRFMNKMSEIDRKVLNGSDY